MTEEELKQEAEENCANNCGDCYGCHKKYRKNKNCEKLKSMIKTYLAAAESREKRIAELEHQLIHRNCIDCSNHSSKLRMRTLELEKENANLKIDMDSSCKAWKKLLDEYKKRWKECEKKNAELKLKLEALDGETPWKDIKDKSEVVGQLTKAKELIKTLLLIADNRVSQMEFQLCVADAKQFLNSEVEK